MRSSYFCVRVLNPGLQLVMEHFHTVGFNIFIQVKDLSFSSATGNNPVEYRMNLLTLQGWRVGGVLLGGLLMFNQMTDSCVRRGRERHGK